MVACAGIDIGDSTDGKQHVGCGTSVLPQPASSLPLLLSTRIQHPDQGDPAMTAPSGPKRDVTSRRRFLTAAGTAAAVPAAAALIGGGPLAGTRRGGTTTGAT